MNAPKISVLIPMYNRKHYIAQCIDSALNQTFQDFEIIICDNDSTDGSADFVATKYAAEIFTGKIKLLRNERNMGGTFSGNKLLRKATGKYFMILHSDDMYLPPRFNTCTKLPNVLMPTLFMSANFLLQLLTVSLKMTPF